MGKTVYIREEQLAIFKELSDIKGKRIVKHLPDSSDFHAKMGSWKNFWLSKNETTWPLPKDGQDENVGCHVVDIFSQEIFIYPKPNSENVGIRGNEDDYIFVVDKSLTVPFKIEDSNYVGPCKSPEEHLKQALSKISFL